MTAPSSPSASEIQAAHRRIAPHVHRTRLLEAPTLSPGRGAPAWLKMEGEQLGGSFKIRGALNKVLRATSEQRDQGFVTASTGNHARGFCHALGIAPARATVVVPENVDPSKLNALSAFDVEIVRHGRVGLDAELHGKALALERGATWISPYNDRDVIAGQGTIGIELLEQLPSLEEVYVCVGGGGLISGIATWLKSKRPDVRIVGALPESSPEMYLSVQTGAIVPPLTPPRPTLSDGSAGGVEDGAITFPICRQLVTHWILVSENEIEDAIRRVHREHDITIEGAAGVAVAAFRKAHRKGESRVAAIVICGSNIGDDNLRRVLDG